MRLDFRYECWLCSLCVCCITPMLIGIFFFYSGTNTTRNKDISIYNDYATKWTNSTVFGYNGKFIAIISGYTDEEENNLFQKTVDIEISREKIGSAYPYRDKSQSGEPEFVDYNPTYFTSTITFEYENISSNITITIYEENKENDPIIIFNTDYNRTDEYDSVDLNCLTGNCNERCYQRNGTWSVETGRCYVNVTLSEFCIRVVRNGDNYVLDYPTRLETLKNSDDNGGCRYDPITQSIVPNYYTSFYEKNITFTVRHFEDPYFICEDLTNGCTGTSNSSDAGCFGISQKTNYYTGGIVLAIGFVAFIIIIALCCISGRTSTVPDTDIEVSVLSIFQLSQKN